MKKGILVALLCFISVVCNAQGIYRTVIKYDKFDDVIWKKEIKTLITQNDNSFVIETKGQEPVEYNLINDNYIFKNGSRDSLVNIVQDLWGYEEYYCVFGPKDKEDYFKYMDERTKDVSDSTEVAIGENKIKIDTYKTFSALYLMSHIDSFPKITIRTVSRYEHVFEYKTDLFWIKFSDGSRIIYER